MIENKDPRKIAFIFKDVSCTVPATKELAEWIMFMLKNHKDDLHFLYKESQLYVQHGGGAGYSVKRWLSRLEKKTKAQLEEFNK